MDARFYRDNPYGSVGLASDEQFLSFNNPNGPVAMLDDKVLRFPDQEPSIVIGGAGSAKFSALGAYQLVHPSTHNFFILDVGGQYQSTTFHWNVAEGRKAYSINPYGISSYPDINHALNLWGILKEDEYLFDNAKRIMEMGVTDRDMGGDNAWVPKGAKRWGARILIVLVYLDGGVTPLSFWEALNTIETDGDYLKWLGRFAEDLPYKVYSNLVEMYAKKHNSEKEWGAIFGCLKDNFDWLSSPRVAESVSGEEDFLRDLGDPNKKVGVYYALPGGGSKFNESLTRMVVGIAQLHCVRAGMGARPLFYIEEAASLGAADFIKSAVSEYRKYFRTILIYQSYGQLEGLFGKAGAQEIIDSCGMQLYMGGGIREITSAQRLADTVGKITIHVDDAMAQAEHLHKSHQDWVDALLHGGDPVAAAHKQIHESRQSEQQRKIGRYAIDAAEILSLKDQVLVVSPGSGIAPILAQKLPAYWTNSAMGGRYGPDPLFPPLDRVVTQGRFFNRTRRFIREQVPEHMASWPNHSNGQIAYVQGYKTWR